MFHSIFLLLLLPMAAFCQDIAGVRPTFTDRNLTIPPNHESIVSRMWMPGVDQGYIPQGVTVAEGNVIVASYNSEGVTPKCRIYRMEPETMTITGHFDLGHYCGHAGGLAYAGLGRLFISDTWRLYEIDLTKAFSQTQSEEMLVRSYSLKFPLRGSFLAYHDGELWVGAYKKSGPGALHALPLQILETKDLPSGLGLEHVRMTLDIAAKSQGATFDHEGYLWLSQSNSQFGRIQKVNPRNGHVLAEYPAVAGIEDLGFDHRGLLWSAGEAGTRKWHNWPTFFPLIFAIDPKILKP